MCAPTITKESTADPPAKEQRDICPLCGEITPMSDFRERSRGFHICKTCNAGYESGKYCATGIYEETLAHRREKKFWGHERKKRWKIGDRCQAVGIEHETRQHNSGLSILTAPPMSFDAILRKHDYIPPPPLPAATSPRRKQEKPAPPAPPAPKPAPVVADFSPPIVADFSPVVDFTPPARITRLSMLDPTCRLPIIDHGPAGTFDAWEAANY